MALGETFEACPKLFEKDEMNRMTSSDFVDVWENPTETNPTKTKSSEIWKMDH